MKTMDPEFHSALRSLAEAFSIGTLEEPEKRAFEAHLASACVECGEAVAAASGTLAALGRVAASETPDAAIRAQLLDLADAPALPIDTSAYVWQQVTPGIRLAALKKDAARGMRACLAWADPGAKHTVHRHEGDELILVLQGGLRDERGEYGPGDLCGSRAGSVHTEEILDRGECFCYVVYYGDLVYLDSPPESRRE
jgi:putative transcriptional regulator